MTRSALTTKPPRTRVYRVKGNPNYPDAGIVALRLVRAPAKALALSHVARNYFDVRLATQEDMEEMLAGGVKVERYTPNGDEHE